MVKLPGLQFGLSLYAQDLVFVPVAMAALFQLLSMRRVPLEIAIALSLSVVFLMSFIRGIGSSGLLAAGVDGRAYFYFLAAALFFATVPVSQGLSAKIVNMWLLGAAALILLAVFRWTAAFAGLGLSAQWQEFSGGAGGSNLRVLTAAQAMFLAVGLFMSVQLGISRAGTLWQRRLAYAIAPVILVLQHRTVWAVTLVGVVWLLLASRQIKAASVLRVIGTIAVGTAIYMFFLGSLTSSLEASATNADTFKWRIEGWKQLLATDRGTGPIDWLMGQPFGSGYLRYIDGYAINVSPHNYYIQTLLRLGAVGLSLLIALYLVSLIGLHRWKAVWKSGIYPDRRVWTVALLAQLCFFIAYAPSYEQGIILGLATSAAVSLHSRERFNVPSTEGKVWPVAA